MGVLTTTMGTGRIVLINLVILDSTEIFGADNTEILDSTHYLASLRQIAITEGGAPIGRARLIEEALLCAAMMRRQMVATNLLMGKF